MTRIYLCGSVKKGASDTRNSSKFWTDDDERFISDNVDGEVELLNPSKTPIMRNDYFVNFGCDMYLVRSANILIADLRSEKGIGIGAELMFAKQSGITVVAWLPKNSHYRRDLEDVFGENLQDWIHPFAFTLSDYIEETLSDVCDRVNRIMSGEVDKTVKCRSVEAAIKYFVAKYPDLTFD